MFRKMMIVGLICVVFVGCAKTDFDNDEMTQKKPMIITSFYPLADFMRKVGGEQVDVINMTEGQEVHEYTPSPGDLQKMYEADLVVVMGGGLEPWAHDVIDQLQAKNVSVLEISEHVPFYQVPEENHESNTGSDDHAHERSGYDPHVWLDPVLMQEVVRVMQKKLSDIDHGHAEDYAMRADRVVADLISLDELYHARLATCERREAIVSHEAFGYVARRYNITLHAIAGLSTVDEPSANVLAKLQEEVREGNMYVLAEQNSVQRFADMIARETSATMLTINAMEKGINDAHKNYNDVMRDNLEVLRTALACS